MEYLVLEISSAIVSLVQSKTLKMSWLCWKLLAYGLVVSMFDFHRSDWGSNPGRGGKISKCLRLHYRAAPLVSV